MEQLGLLCRSYDEELLSDAVLDRCGAHSGILHIGTTADAPVSHIAVALVAPRGFCCYQNRLCLFPR